MLRQIANRVMALVVAAGSVNPLQPAQAELLRLDMSPTSEFQKGCKKEAWLIMRSDKLSLAGSVIFIYREDIDLALNKVIAFYGGCAELLSSGRAVFLQGLKPAPDAQSIGISRGEIGIILSADQFQNVISEFEPSASPTNGLPPPPPHPPFFRFGGPSNGQPPQRHPLEIRDKERICHLDDVCINPAEGKICGAIRCEINGKSVAVNLCSSGEHEIKASVGPTELSFKVRTSGETK